jgi:pectinesterase
LDFYTVGPSRGAGATGVYKDGALAVAKNFLGYSIIENGPDRLRFELRYAPYDAGGLKVTETRRITLRPKSNLNEISTRFNWDGGPDSLDAAVGIVKHAGIEAQKSENAVSVATWETAPAEGSLGLAVVLSRPGKIVESDDHYLLVSPVRRGGVLNYSAGAAWDKSGQFADKAAWFGHIRKLEPATPATKGK